MKSLVGEIIQIVVVLGIFSAVYFILLLWTRKYPEHTEWIEERDGKLWRMTNNKYCIGTAQAMASVITIGILWLMLH